VARTKSILLFGEGKTEAFFLSHLRHLYAGPTTAIKVEHGRGGSVRTVVQAQNGQVTGRLKNCFQMKFPRELLDEARARIPILDEIVRAIE
jgi:hypothetical protein